MSVVVFGSINMDIVVRTPRWPTPGETITGHAYFEAPGGKGANQAVAAARLGVSTAMIGRVGDDGFGQTLRQDLRAAGVDVSRVMVDGGSPTGIALITVDDSAQNSIIIVAGANRTLGLPDLTRLRLALLNAQVLLLQLEVPLDTVLEAARMARAANVTTILDPAPALPSLPAELYAAVDVLTPNETEAALLVGFALDSDAAVVEAGRILLARGVVNVVIKRGAQGIYWANATHSEFRAALPVTAVDTIGAGDAFNAGLAAALIEDKPLHEALNWGVAAGALATTKAGGIPAMPDRATVLAALQRATTVDTNNQIRG